MKANAPDKIYVHVKANKELGTTWHGTRIGINDVEYVRTDAFIEKACEYWYKYNHDVVKERRCEFTVNVQDFKNYLKGD